MVHNLLRHYKKLVEALLGNSEEKISELSFMSTEEENQLLFSFNDTEVSYPTDETIVELFEQRACVGRRELLARWCLTDLFRLLLNSLHYPYYFTLT